MTLPLDVILAEDNLIQRVYLARMIEHLGYRTIQAEDGQEALDLLRATRAQILISDYHMPHMNGIDLTRAVRGLNLDHYVHIIMITGDEHSEIADEALEAGVDDFLPKGQDSARLRARMQTASRLICHAKELADQHRVVKEANEHIHEDLKLAAAAQRDLLPDIHKDLMGYHIASAFLPSAVVSGDMFGCFTMSGNKLGIYLVDVSGHGISASLLSVAIGHLITPEFFMSIAIDPDGTPNPAALVKHLNNRFCNSGSDSYFTMFCSIIDKETGHMDFCQAGYPSPVYTTEDGGSQFIGDGGFPVGIFADATFENSTTILAYDGLLVFCSDAAIEAENPTQIAFGLDRFRTLVAGNRAAKIDELPDIIVESLVKWRGGRAMEDDLTVVALRRRKTNDSLH